MNISNILLCILLFNIHLCVANLYCDAPTSNQIQNDATNNIIDIKFSLVSSVNEITIIAILETTPPDSLIQENANSIDFELQYKENGIEKFKKCHYNVSLTDPVERVFPFYDLKYFTEYTIKVGYTNKNGESFWKDTKSFTTCFGTPNQPADFSYTFDDKKKCAISITWKEPNIVNAPNVCYYELKFRDGVNRERSYTTNSTSYGITLDANKAYNFYLQSVNNGTCYKNQFPSVQNCKLQQTASNSSFFNVNTPSKCDVNSSKIFSTNIILLFCSLVLVIFCSLVLK